MVSSVSSASAASSAYAASSAALAKEALGLLLKSPDLLESLASRSFEYLPPSNKMILSTLWGLLNQDGDSEITQSDVEKAVYEVGASAAPAFALWGQMSPDYTTTMSVVDFAANEYLLDTIPSMTATVREDVEQSREESASASPVSNSLLDYIAPYGASGTILDIFA
ncbi:MAG: hypothetical protein V1721_10490 [Pseudomonadota bacterium]